MRYKNVIFDMDGVLIDNSEGITSTAKYAIEKLGLPVPEMSTLRKFIGPALVWSLQEYCGATEEQAMLGLKIYREKYLVTGIKQFVLYDGVYDTVKALFEAGVRLPVSSGKPIECVNNILVQSGMTKFFEVTAGTTFPAKVSHKDEQMKKAVLDRPALMVGDRVFDLECAKKANVDCAFARYGFGDASDYAEIKPKYFIDKATDLLAIVL